MASQKFLVDIDLRGNALRSAKLQSNAGSLGGTSEAQVYYDSATKRLAYHNGTANKNLVESGGVVDADIATTAAIAYAKLSLAGTIVNTDIAVGADIAYSKLDLATSIVDGDISATAAIAYAKLNLLGSIVNDDIDDNAAIGYPKLNLAGAIADADIAVGAAIALSKLATDPLARANHTGTQVAATISDFANAVAALGYATQAGLNAAIAGVDWKDTVQAATTSNVTVGSAVTSGTINTAMGYYPHDNDRLALLSQTAGTQSGLYAVGTPTGKALTLAAGTNGDLVDTGGSASITGAPSTAKLRLSFASAVHTAAYTEITSNNPDLTASVGSGYTGIQGTPANNFQYRTNLRVTSGDLQACGKDSPNPGAWEYYEAGNWNDVPGTLSGSLTKISGTGTVTANGDDFSSWINGAGMDLSLVNNPGAGDIYEITLSSDNAGYTNLKFRVTVTGSLSGYVPNVFAYHVVANTIWFTLTDLDTAYTWTVDSGSTNYPTGYQFTLNGIQLTTVAGSQSGSTQDITVTGNITLTRTTDMDEAAEFQKLVMIPVQYGTLGSKWYYISATTERPFVVGTDTATFTEFTHPSYSGTAPITVSGTTISHDASGVTAASGYNLFTVNATGHVTTATTETTLAGLGITAAGRKFASATITGDDATTDFDITHNFASRDIAVAVREAQGTYDMVDALVTEAGSDGTNKVRVSFSTAPATGTNYRVVIHG